MTEAAQPSSDNPNVIIMETHPCPMAPDTRNTLGAIRITKEQFGDWSFPKDDDAGKSTPVTDVAQVTPAQVSHASTIVDAPAGAGGGARPVLAVAGIVALLALVAIGSVAVKQFGGQLPSISIPKF